MDSYAILRLAQVFDPSYAAANLNPGMVDDLMAIIPLANLDLLADLKKELPASHRVLALDPVSAASRDVPS